MGAVVIGGLAGAATGAARYLARRRGGDWAYTLSLCAYILVEALAFIAWLIRAYPREEGVLPGWEYYAGIVIIMLLTWLGYTLGRIVAGRRGAR